MPDLNTALMALNANPDAAPVFADWFDEKGLPDAATWLREFTGTTGGELLYGLLFIDWAVSAGQWREFNELFPTEVDRELWMAEWRLIHAVMGGNNAGGEFVSVPLRADMLPACGSHAGQSLGVADPEAHAVGCCERDRAIRLVAYPTALRYGASDGRVVVAEATRWRGQCPRCLMHIIDHAPTPADVTVTIHRPMSDLVEETLSPLRGVVNPGDEVQFVIDGRPAT